jgi:hypothetical protein
MKNTQFLTGIGIFLLILNTFVVSANGFQHHFNMESDTLKKGGIVFFRTNQLQVLEDFYLHEIGCELWLDQGACKIFQHGNMLFGFCESEEMDQEGTITFFYPDREQVDRMYEQLRDIALNPPKMNEKFNIYNFYARDPEGHLIEFQSFNHELEPYYYR